MHTPAAAVMHNPSPNSCKAPPECTAYWCLLSYTSGPLRLTVSPAPWSSEQQYFWKMNPTATHWCFMFQLAAADYRDTDDLFFFLPPSSQHQYSLLSKTLITHQYVYPVGGIGSFFLWRITPYLKAQLSNMVKQMLRKRNSEQMGEKKAKLGSFSVIDVFSRAVTGSSGYYPEGLSDWPAGCFHGSSVSDNWTKGFH